MDQQQRDEIHEEASSHYLSGEFDAAREAWQRLLEVDPTDERAAEGIRLCSQMAGGEEDSVWTHGQSPFAAAAKPSIATEPAAADGFDFSEIDDALEGKIGGPAENSLDLSGLGDELGTGLAVPTPEPAPTGSGSSDESWGWGLGEADPASATESVATPPLDPSTVELRRRVNELLANALVFMEQGRKDEAVKTLERLLILDETNDAALSLRAKMVAESDDDRPFDAAAIEGTSGPHDAMTAVDHGAMEGDDLPPLELALGPAEGGEDPFPFEPDETIDRLSDESPMGDATGSNANAVPSIAGVEALPERPNSGRIWLYGVVTMVALAALAIFGLRQMSSDASGPEPLDPAAAAAAAATEVDNSLKPVALPESIGRKPPAAAPAAAPPKEDLLVKALNEGESAMGVGNYDRAVIAYDRALKLRPGSIEIRQRLDRATAKYREAQEIDAKWSETAGLWEAGNFKSALRNLYRLPDNGDPGRVQRLQALGWYNLGVQSLRAGDCESAGSHFDEAYGLDGENPTIQAGTWLAASCPGQGASTYKVQVDALGLQPFE